MRELERDVDIFDFDGTIADTKASILSTATTVLSRWGFGERDLQRVGELIGPPFPQAFEWVFGLTAEDAVEVTRQYREIYNNLGIEAWPAFPARAFRISHASMAPNQTSMLSLIRPLVHPRRNALTGMRRDRPLKTA